MLDIHQLINHTILVIKHYKVFQSFLFYCCPSGIKPCRGGCWCWSILFRKPLSLLSSASAPHSDLFHRFLCLKTVVVQTCTVTFHLYIRIRGCWILFVVNSPSFNFKLFSLTPWFSNMAICMIWVEHYKLAHPRIFRRLMMGKFETCVHLWPKSSKIE